ncbi:hypothetical protein K492DRAFT_134371 [Lichtheimia hyalospora FSU 10163]|nr:hypothetical protein K492DRAFT_134371 [Lichtheimia hyalospora FSU 10163]
MSDDPFDVDKTYDVTPNWHVVNCTTPAQYFHVLRRQMIRDYRKPLIVMAPKGLLKSAVAVSPLNDMGAGTSFQPVLDDPACTEDPGSVEKVVFVSGKLYYDLAKERAAKGLDNQIALVRLEELCPFPRDQIEQVLNNYYGARDFVWCQEEPQNAGAYSFIAPRLTQLLPYQSKVYCSKPYLYYRKHIDGTFYRLSTLANHHLLHLLLVLLHDIVKNKPR